MSGLDDTEFAAMLAAATLARGGLQPEQIAGPAPSSADYRIAGNDNAVITQAATLAAAGVGYCRAGCGVPLAPALTDTVHGGSPHPGVGLHANCEVPPAPPSTLAEVAGALMRYEQSRPRSVQTTLGPSELGTPCARQMAMKLAGVQRHERGLAWAPMCGTAVHSLMEDVLTRENERLGRQRWIIEETVHLDDELTGHGDAYDSDHALVIDWKYTGTTARRKASRRSVPNSELVSMEYRVQAHLYGLGHENAGRPVRHVRLVMLARSHDYGESVEWTEEYRPDIAIDAMTRFYAVRDRVVNLDAATHPERLADVEATPGDACKWCPFKRLPEAGRPDVDATGCVGNSANATDPTHFLR